jgi:long-chain fatty acid transport protein
MAIGAFMRPVVVALAAAGAGWAQAAGFQLLEQNASGLGLSYAGSAAVAEDASTIFFNPAGMMLLRPREASLGLAAVRPSFKFRDRGSVFAPGVPASGGNGGDAGGWGYVPDAYLSWELRRDLRVGLGMSVPFGLLTDYDNGWVGRFQAAKFEVATLNLNPSVAYRVNDRFSLGFGVNWQRLDAEYLRSAAAVSAAPALIPGLRATTVKLDVSDDSWGWNAGVLLTLSPSTRLGVSYRSSVDHTLEGSLRFSGPLANSALTGGLTSDGDVRAKVELPDTWIISVVQELDARWTLLGDLSRTGWSSIPRLDIVRTSGALAGTTAQTLDADFRDTWRIALGTTYRYSDDLSWKFGIAYDQAPVRGASTRLVALPDNNRTWLSTGLKWRPAEGQALDLGVAYLFVPESRIHNDQIAQGRGLVSGTYDARVWILGVQYGTAF